MTKFIFHGDDQAGTRRDLRNAIAKESKDSREIRTIDGLKVTPKDIDSVLGTANLFASETIVIENVVSRPLSNDKKKILLTLKNYEGDKNLILWEKKELTKTQINSLGSGVIAKLSKVPVIIFKLLESIVPGNSQNCLNLLHETAVASEEGYIFVMISRHLGELIIAKSGDTSSLNPWKKGKLILQAEGWSESGLIAFHSRLLMIDRSIKTGQTKLSYMDHLDLLIADLLN